MKNTIKRAVLWFNDNTDTVLIWFAVAYTITLFLGISLTLGILDTILFLLGGIVGIISFLGVAYVVVFLYQKLLKWAEKESKENER